MPIRISKELISDTDKLLPIRMFFNEQPDNSFIRLVSIMLEGSYGFALDLSSYNPKVYMDCGNKTILGALFQIHQGIGVVVEYPTAMKYIRIACTHYLQDHPEDAAVLDAVLKNSKLIAD